MAGMPCGRVVRVLDLKSECRGFKYPCDISSH